MPTYDYECIKCGYTFEESLKIADRDAPTELPCVQQVPKTKHMSFECGGEVKQMIVAPGFAYDNIPSKGHPKKTPRRYRRMGDRDAIEVTTPRQR